MPKLRLAAVVLLVLCSPLAAEPATQPVTAEAILLRHVEAIGGQAARDDVTSQRQVGTLELPALGITGELTILVAAPDKIRVTVNLPGLGVIEQGAAGSVGWANDPFSGPRVMSDIERLLLTRVINSEDPMKGFTSAKVAGEEEIAGTAATRVDLVAEAGHQVSEWYAIETGLRLKRTATWQTDFGPEEQSIVYSDYRPIGESTLLAPHRSEQNAGGNDIVVTIKETQSNPELDDDAFAPPPAVAKLLEEEL